VTITYLLTNVAEASVLSDTLKCLSQDWIKWFVTVAKLSRGIARYGKSSNINLYRDKTEICTIYKEIHHIWGWYYYYFFCKTLILLRKYVLNWPKVTKHLQKLFLLNPEDNNSFQP